MKNENKNPLSQEELEQQLRALNNSLPDAPDFTQQVMTRIQANSILPAQEKDNRLWRWCMKGSIGIAACLAVGLVAWHFGVDSPRIAYGIDDIPQKMLSLKSLHLKGTIYGQGPTGTPIEAWAQRPGKLRVNGQRNDTNGATESFTDEIITPTQWTLIDSQNKKVTVSPDDPVSAALDTEQFLQQETQMLLGPSIGGGGKDSDFKKIRTETIQGIQADVYESKNSVPNLTFRMEVALNPATGLPLRSAMYMTPHGETEKMAMSFDTIEPNITLPDSTFTFTPPPDYTVTKSSPDPLLSGMNFSQAGDMKSATRYAIALDDHSILICWAAYDTKDPTNDLTLPPDTKVIFHDNKNNAYAEKLLHADETPEGYHWRWSLLTTDKPSHSPFGSLLSIDLHAGHNTTSNTVAPIQLPADQLSPLIEGAQRLTVPADSKDAKVMTLKEIEAQK